MAANTAAAFNSIDNLFDGIMAELGFGPDAVELYASDVGIPKGSAINLKNWNKLLTPYTFSVVNILGTDAHQRQSVDFKDFPLPLAPTKITQTEMPAIAIKPTQGGTVTSHSSIKYKKLTIEGTTGINPFRGMSGVDSTTGQAIAKPKELKFKSGYEVFILLRNWFRAFYAFKTKSTPEAKNSRIIFKNYKDGEFLIVELLDFTMDRSAERSLLYDYKLEFKVLSHFDFSPRPIGFFEDLDDKINAVTSKIDTLRGVFLGVQETLRQIEASYNSTVLEPMRKIGLAAKAFGNIGLTASDISRRIIKNTASAADALHIDSIIRAQKNAADIEGEIRERVANAKIPKNASDVTIDTLLELDDALLDIPLEELPEATQDAALIEIAEVSDLPRSFYENVISDLERIRANAEDSFNLAAPILDGLLGRVATLEADAAKEVTPEEFELLGAFNDSISAINELMASTSLFKSEFAVRIDSLESQFEEALGLQAQSSVKTIIVTTDTDLEQIALDELGDAKKWPEIAELNNLQAPYIIQDLSNTRTDVKKPGQSLLIPQDPQGLISEIPRAKDIPTTDGMSEAERALGTDLKLTETSDLDLANNGDLAVISGNGNMSQAVILKINYEKGELKSHPGLGTGLSIGGKFIPLPQIRDDLLATLLQDPRIANISSVLLLREGSSLTMNFDIALKTVDTPVPLSVKL